MFQILGAFLVIAGMTGLGFSYMERLQERVRLLQRWEYIFRLFQSEVSYKKQPLSLASFDIGDKIKGREGEILKEIGEKLDSGQEGSFPMIWEEQWKNYLKASSLSSEEKEEIIGFASFTGFEEEELQHNMLQIQKNKMEKFGKEVQQESKEKRRVVILISSCIGIFLVLLLL